MSRDGCRIPHTVISGTGQINSTVLAASIKAATGLVLRSEDPTEPRHGHISAWPSEGIYEVVLYDAAEAPNDEHPMAFAKATRDATKTAAINTAITAHKATLAATKP